MPNPSLTRNHDSQNGEDNNGQISPQILTERETSIRPLASPSEDWSSLTQELIDTLPRVQTRGLLYLLIVFVSIALPWAMLSEVDETGSARGRLEPKGKTLRLDVPVAGTVTAVKVKEGQTVRRGQVLLELDSALTRSELQQAQARLEGQLNRLVQLNLIANQLEISQRTQQQQNLAQQSAQLAQLEQTQQRLNFNRKAYLIAKSRLAADTVEEERYRELLREGVVAPIKLVEIQRTRNESQQTLNQAASDFQQAQSEIKKQRSDRRNIISSGELSLLETSERIKQIQSQIVELQSEVTQNRKLITSLKYQIGQRIIKATTGGTVFQFATENYGSVLQVGQMVTQIAPQGAKLVFRAQMPSSESGFLKLGLPVKLKFDAYPFQDYGVVSGRLRWISPDSKIVDTAQGKVEIFELEITLDRTYIQTQNKRIALSPGQTATAEVIVRQRRLIDFILDPFKKLQKGGLKL